jgi:hypothetical protein
MKKVFIASIVLITISIFAFMPSAGFTQDARAEKKKEQAATIKSIVVDSQHYVFLPQTALPTTGNSRNLSYGYAVTVSASKVESYLPYFGRAYSADYGSTASPLDFISSDFSYTITNRKKGGWDITIEFKDTKDVKKMQFSIFENGSATLQVISDSRQPISFNGTIESVKPKTEKAK